MYWFFLCGKNNYFCRYIMNIFHKFDIDISGIELPKRLNSPFNYEPHPLARIAAMQVRRHIAENPQLENLFSQGKMLGVLVVADGEGQCGFVAAYSGSLEQTALLQDYFAPPVFDLLDAEGYFKQQECEISGINREIEAVENGPLLAEARRGVEVVEQEARAEVEGYKRLMAQSKVARDAARAAGSADEAMLMRESQHQKAELKRLRKAWGDKIEAARRPLAEVEARLVQLREERHRRSEALQRWIFGQFSMLNACGESRDLIEIFSATPQGVPPAGAGECAAPRLLQYAYMHGLMPLSIAEFWYGKPQGGHVRRDGEFYTACRGKCLPILTFMLQGLDVELDPPYEGKPFTCADIAVIYEDQWMVAVDKPAGLPTVPGKNCGKSLLELLQEEERFCGELLPVHRLDMDTSGVVLFARDRQTQKRLQSMFATRTMAKQYVALLDGLLVADGGTIDLPLRPDYEHRPMQVVDEVDGAPAVTRYEVVERYPGKEHTLVRFYPLTGRTHQLRVHSAHHLGLGIPIVGDRLYGKAGERLCLHAQCLSFVHPQTGKPMELQSPLPSVFGSLEQFPQRTPQQGYGGGKQNGSSHHVLDKDNAR